MRNVTCPVCFLEYDSATHDDDRCLACLIADALPRTVRYDDRDTRPDVVFHCRDCDGLFLAATERRVVCPYCAKGPSRVRVDAVPARVPATTAAP
jgi:hypothetical protein